MSRFSEFLRNFVSLLIIVGGIIVMLALFAVGYTLIVAGTVFLGGVLVALAIALFLAAIAWLATYL